MSCHDRRGFILPLSVLLVIILTISGTAFMQHDYLERRMAMNTVDNHGGFYLANAGIERARKTFKFTILENGQPNWTTVLNGTYDGKDSGTDPDYPIDTNVSDPLYGLLCPVQCVTPSFQTPANPLSTGTGEPVIAPDMPFGGTFNDGLYTVRAFNDTETPGETETTDNNGVIRVRTLGNVRGELKILQADIMAASSVQLINCDEAYNPTDESCDEYGANTTTTNLEGREPVSDPSSALPTWNQSYYSDYQNFPSEWTLTRQSDLAGGVTLTSLANNSYYFVDGDVVIQNTGTNDHVVIFSAGEMHVSTNVTLNESIVIGLNGVQMNGGVTIDSPQPYPAIISGGAVHGNTGVNVFGTIYSFNGGVDLRGGTYVEGVIISVNGPVDLRGTADITDNGDLSYYNFMPGFTYPEEMKTTVFAPGGTWREIQ